MPVVYRRPDPADSAAARTRLARLTGSADSGSAGHLPPQPGDVRAEALPAGMLPAEVLPAEVLPAELAAKPQAADSLGRRRDDLAPPDPAPRPAAAGHVPPPLVALWSSWRARLTPSNLRGARLDPGGRGVAAIAVVAVLAAVIAAAGVWRSRPQSTEVTAPRIVVPTSAPSSSRAPAVVVAVAGGVRRPGLFTLPLGSRVADAIRAAGGIRPGTSIGLLNLARRLVDGEQVIVGATAASSPGVSAGAAGGPGAPVNLNIATLEQLDALPGVGPVLAQRILDYRSQHGAFRSVDQLRDVGGIGEAKFADLKSLVTV